MDSMTFIFAFVHVFLSVYSFTIPEESLKDVIFKNDCNFPPRYLGDEYADKFEPCSQRTSNAVLEIICGNLRLESKCDMKDVAMPSTLVTLNLFTDKGKLEEKAAHLAQLCSYMENLPWSEENTCLNLCGNDAFFICDLYVAMDSALRDLFIREVQNYTHLDAFIHPGSLKFLYPFPPIGALHSPDLLDNCRTPSQDSVTNLLCTVMAEVAIQYVKARLAVRLHEGEFVRNVSSEWDPCTGISRFSNFSASSHFISLLGNCAQLCKDQLGVCKTIYLGLEKYQEAASTETSTATGSQLTNFKLDAQLINSEGTGIKMSEDSLPGSVTGEKSHPRPVLLTGTGEESQAGTETKPGSVLDTDIGKESLPGTETKPDSVVNTETGKKSLPVTETKPGSVVETETGKEPQAGTETKPSSVVETETGQESQAGTEIKPGPVVETETGQESQAGTEIKPGPVVETETGKEILSGTETKPGSVVETETGKEPQAGTETKPSSVVNTETGESLPGTETKPGPVVETETGQELQAGTETKPGPVVETETGQELQAGTETKPGPVVETETGQESQAGTETKPGPVVNTETGQESQAGTETKPGPVVETETGQESQAGTETKPEFVVESGTGEEPQLGSVTETKPAAAGVSQGSAFETKTTAAIQLPTTSDFESNFDEDYYYNEEYPDVFREPSPAAGQLDRVEEQGEVFKPKETKLDQAVYIDDEDDESSGSHFMAYFLVFIVLSIAGYIIFHNKQKIIALVVEGKSAKGSRRPSTKDYKQLKTEDVMPSLEKSAYSKDYVF